MFRIVQHNLGVILLLLLSSELVFPQDKQGMAGSNYLSTSALFLNPANTSDSRCFLQFNLMDVGTMISTNIAYLPKLNPYALMFGASPPEPVPKTTSGEEFVQLRVDAMGPAFVISTMDFGAGVFTRVRSNSMAKGMSYDAMMQIIDPSSDYHNAYPEQIKVNDVMIGSMTWAEYGLNYSKMLRLEPKHLLQIGGNLKYLTGINLNYKRVNELEAYLVDSTYQVIRLKASDKYNDPVWNSGKGFSADLGFTYKKMLNNISNYYVNSKRSNCKFEEYKYKLSASLLDVGAINFTKGTFQAKVDTTVYTSEQDQSFTGNFDDYYKANQPILAMCPSALVLQGDYNFENRIYLNALLIKNLIPDAMVGAQASNLICIAPRYETRTLEISLPLTLQRFRYPYLGVAFRVRTFVLGVDNVIPFVVPSNTSHFGVYFKLGLSLFRNQACNTKRMAVDDCRPGLKRKKTPRKVKQGNNISKKTSLKKRIITWL
ncbi:MAG: DUF5723 family protein [Bacteroidia bacterium]|nr:DUF5723 family protein [Bacteroidia bacterium]